MPVVPDMGYGDKMKIIIHAGMNKTGSTSIQRTFAALAEKQERYTYAPADDFHHNYLFNLGFCDLEAALRQQPYFRVRGMSKAAMQAQGERERQRLADALGASARPLFLFSAESLRGQFLGAVPRFADFCRRFTGDIQVIAYVRRPVSYMQSAFEQRLRGVLECARFPLLFWPEYRLRFEALCEAFGAGRVKFKLYDRARLKGGDVALDFAEEIGVPLSPADVIAANEAIGLEATACVFAFKSLLPPRRPAPWRWRQQERFAEALRPLSKTRLAFTAEVLAPMLAQKQDDLRWMEERLGEPLLDSLPQAAGASPAVTEIGGTQALLAIADRQAAAVEALAGVESPPGASKRRRLLHALTALYNQCAQDQQG